MRHTFGVFILVVAGCGGRALEPSSAEDGGVGSVPGRDAGQAEAGYPDTVDGSLDAQGAHDGNALPDSRLDATADGSPSDAEVGPIHDSGGVCSMPVGEVAPGCPMALTPQCDGMQGGTMYGDAVCTHQLVLDPLMVPYVDVALDGPQGGRLLRVADAAACATTGNGWYFDDPSNPTSFTVCPEACDCAQQMGETFALTYGCWSNAAPGVVDAEIPCPRCASSRTKSCSTTGGGFSYGIPMCSFQLEAGFELAQTNIKYCKNCPTAGLDDPMDGYLTYIESLDQCDGVEEGWTLDVSTSPPTVLICPSACSCAKVHGAVFEAQYGCPRQEAH